jgi:tetratricopeptide (TPR) repeat protein
VVLGFAFWALLGQAGECPVVLQAAKNAYNDRKYDDAVAQFQQAHAACGQPLVTLLPLAQAQLLAQRPEASLETLQSLLKLQPENLDALKLQGDVLYLLGRAEEGEKSLKAVLALDGSHAGAQYALGRIYYQQNRFVEAIARFTALIERDPSNYRAHDNLALCYAAVQQDGDALRHFLKALDLVHKDHPEYDTVYANAAIFFTERGQFEKAFQLGVEAAKRNPLEARNFFITGKALTRLEKPELSVRWFLEAAKLDPAYTDPHYWLATVYRKLGKVDEAKAELETFRKLNMAQKVKR